MKRSDSQGNILVCTFWNYNDGLIQTYTLPYLRLIKKNLPETSVIYFQTLEKKKWEGKEHQELSKKLQQEGIYWEPIPYHPLGLRAIITWIRFFIKWLFKIPFKNVQWIHAFAPPAGVAAYFLASMTGRKLVIDSAEPHAEAMVENKEWKHSDLAFKFLSMMEKRMFKKADTVIGTTQEMKNYILERTGSFPKRFYSKPAGVDLSLFHPNKKKKKELIEKYDLEGKTVCVYAGKFGGIYLEKEVFDLFKVGADHFGGKFKALLITPTPYHEIRSYCYSAGLKEDVIEYVGTVPHERIPDHMGLGDFAINPVKPVPSKRYCTSIKDGEYWALGLPVVITKNISDDSRIISENNIGYVLEDLSKEEYARACKKIEQLIQEKNISQKIREIARRRGFKESNKIYQEIYNKDN